MYPGESISLKTPTICILMIESCNITKYNAYHKQSSTSSTCYTQYNSDLNQSLAQISSAACLPPLLNTCMRMNDNGSSKLVFTWKNHVSTRYNVGKYVGKLIGILNPLIVQDLSLIHI